MSWKDPTSSYLFSWIYIIAFAAWGGIVRYIIDVKLGQTNRSLIAAIAQIIVSAFTGVLAGLVAQNIGSSIHITLAISGISGAMGVVAINYYWIKLTGSNNGAL